MLTLDQKYRKSLDFMRLVANQNKSNELENPEDGDWEGGFDVLVQAAREIIQILEN